MVKIDPTLQTLAASRMAPARRAAAAAPGALGPAPGAPASEADRWHGQAIPEDPAEIPEQPPVEPQAPRSEAPAPKPQERWSAQTSAGLLLAEAPGDGPTALALLDAPSAMTPSDAAALVDIHESLGEHPQLVDVLERFLADKEHPMNLVGYLKSPESRPVVLEHLKGMAALEQPAPEDMPRIMQECDRDDVTLFRSDDESFSLRDGTKGSQALRQELLARDPELFSTGSEPTDGQGKKLDGHAKHLRNVVLPSLTEALEDLVSDLPAGEGFPAVNARAKSAAGMVDKIGRMRAGNDGKAPRPDYSLADMPDAVGGRITVRTPEELQKVMYRLEERFGKDAIFEKDNFYSNPAKKARPYRCITYTVMHEGVPCEVQLTTLNASLVADLWHNTGYKPLHPDLPQDTMKWLGGLQRAVTADEHRTLAAGAP